MNLTTPQEAYQKAMCAALRLLKHKDRTLHEVQVKLLEKGFKEAETKLVLTTLTNSGYIDDSRVADRAAEIAIFERPVGRLKLEHELRARGASESDIERVLAEFDGPSETARAEALLKKRMKPGDSAQKSASFLVRKGFDEEVVRVVIERSYDEFE